MGDKQCFLLFGISVSVSVSVFVSLSVSADVDICVKIWLEMPRRLLNYDWVILENGDGFLCITNSSIQKIILRISKNISSISNKKKTQKYISIVFSYFHLACIACNMSIKIENQKRKKGKKISLEMLFT